ncbi:tyrosine-type recombinase/integrase [Pseudonocardia sp. CA-107938]|uniref:tyrosine-type recombinase/integrase n=1 Tax=Pseudonocardia sp. CA-107938 TaxID=3240021 RepID=UPI003D942835
MPTSSPPRSTAASRISPGAISQRYRRLAIRLELRSTRLHSLRHYSATELVAAGVDIRTVAGRLGHGSGGATTIKVYAAWVNVADRRAAVAMATIVPKPVPAPARPRGPYESIADVLREQISSGELRPVTCSRQLPRLPSRMRWPSGQLTALYLA